MLGDNDLLSSQFNCVNEGVILANADLSITKINKSAEVLLNTSSQVAVGKRVSEMLGPKNSHLMKPVTEVSQSEPYRVLIKTEVHSSKGANEAGQSNAMVVPVNFHVTKLHDAEKKLNAYCLVLQPIIRATAN